VAEHDPFWFARSAGSKDDRGRILFFALVHLGLGGSGILILALLPDGDYAGKVMNLYSRFRRFLPGFFVYGVKCYQGFQNRQFLFAGDDFQRLFLVLREGKLTFSKAQNVSKFLNRYVATPRHVRRPG